MKHILKVPNKFFILLFADHLIVLDEMDKPVKIAANEDSSRNNHLCDMNIPDSHRRYCICEFSYYIAALM